MFSTSLTLLRLKCSFHLAYLLIYNVLILSLTFIYIESHSYKQINTITSILNLITIVKHILRKFLQLPMYFVFKGTSFIIVEDLYYEYDFSSIFFWITYLWIIFYSYCLSTPFLLLLIYMLITQKAYTYPHSVDNPVYKYKNNVVLPCFHRILWVI